VTLNKIRESDKFQRLEEILEKIWLNAKDIESTMLSAESGRDDTRLSMERFAEPSELKPEPPAQQNGPKIKVSWKE
jgi:hypothetical protein